MNTKMSYMYRDSDNYKDYTEIIVCGAITEEQIDRIIGKLSDKEYFIPEQLGLPANRLDSYAYDPDVDHPYCELGRDSFELTEEEATEDLTVDELVAKFEAVEHWDESLNVYEGRPVRGAAKSEDKASDVPMEYVKVRIKRAGKTMTVPFLELKDGDELINPNYPCFVCDGDAHLCGDASYDEYIVYDEDGDDYSGADFIPTPVDGIGAVFIQFAPDDLCTKADINRLMGLLGAENDTLFDVLRVEADNAFALGLVSEDVASRTDFDDSHDGKFLSGIRAILDDVSLENADGRYKIAGVDVMIVYPEEMTV